MAKKALCMILAKRIPDQSHGATDHLGVWLLLLSLVLPLLPYSGPVVQGLHQAPRRQPVRAERDSTSIHPVVGLFNGDIGLSLLPSQTLAVGKILDGHGCLQVVGPTKGPLVRLGLISER
jgi:hypothetical protein